jgi:hypothetical protein
MYITGSSGSKNTPLCCLSCDIVWQNAFDCCPECNATEENCRKANICECDRAGCPGRREKK